MADEREDPLPVPLGAQVMRKMHAALKMLHGDCSKAHGALDECEAKSVIGEHLSAAETSMGSLAKAFGKFYKGIDLEEEQEEAEEEAEEAKTEPEKKPQIEDDKPEPKKDDDLDPVEKSLLVTRLRKLESEIRHEERLRRMAKLKNR